MKLFRVFLILAVLVCGLIWLSCGDTYDAVNPVLLETPVPMKVEKKKEIVIPVTMVAVAKPPPLPQKKVAPPSPTQKKAPVQSATQQPKTPKSTRRVHNSGAVRGHQDPAIIASFANVKVVDYLTRMETMGARIALYDRQANGFACRLRPDGVFAGPVSTAGMSPRARTLTSDFPGGKTILAKAGRRYGVSQYEIVLLMPHKLDKRFQQGIKNVIRGHGQNFDEVISVWVNYRLAGSGVQVLVQQLETRSGSVAVNDVFTL